MSLALAQINTTVGDLDGNRERILVRMTEARGRGRRRRPLPRARDHRLPAGGPPAAARASSMRPRRRSPRSRARLAASSRSSATPHLDRDLYNACAVCAAGEVKAIYRKRFLPNYGVFDEHRYFAPGRDLVPARARRGARSGRPCARTSGSRARPRPTSRWPARSCSSTSRRRPFHVGKEREREQMLQTRARDNVCYIAFVNAVGGQDELRLRRALGRARRRGRGARTRAGVRGGAARRRHRARRKRLGAGCATCGGGRSKASGKRRRTCRSSTSARRTPDEPVAATVARSSTTSSRCGWRSSSGCATTSEKNGFGDVVVGVSGGIDSALDRGARLRGARARPRPLRLDAVAVQLGRDAPTMPGGWPSRSAPTSSSCRSSRSSKASSRRSPRCSPAASPTRPRRTSRLAFEASC